MRRQQRTPLVLACLALVAALSAGARAQVVPSPAPAASPQTEPACALVVAALTGTLDTKRVKAGASFAFSTVAPVDFNGDTIAAGTPGVGVVATLDHSKSQGHSGYLVLEARYLERADGTHVPVAFVPAGDGHSQAFVRAGSSDAGLLGYLPYYIGTAAGIYNTFHHGKDAAVVSGTRFRLIVGDAFYTGACRVEIDTR